MSDAKYRIIFISLAIAFVAVIIAAFAFGSPSSDQAQLPPAIEGISPLPASQVPSQMAVEVDVPVGYRIEMFIDGFRVPESELRFVEGTGVYSFIPEDSSVIAWNAGSHTVLVRWSRLGGLPDEGDYRWTFRTY